MAFTKVLGPGIHTLSNITSHNINSSGIVTAVSFVGDGSGLTGVASTDSIITGTAATFNTYPVDINAGMTVAGVATFSGNLTVGGVLTYEDVKNVDSIGVVTARNGIDCNGDIDVDGHTNLDNVSIAGVTTFTDDVYFDGATANRDIIFDRSANTLQVKPNAKLKLGQGSYSTDLYTDGTNTIIDHNQVSGLFVKSNIFQVYGTGTSGGNTYDGTIFRCMNGKTELGYEVPNGGTTTLDNLVTTPKGVTVGTGVTIERNGQATFVGVTTFGNVVGGAATSVVVNRDFVLRDVWGYGNHIKFHWGTNTINFPSASLSNIARVPNLSFGDRTNNGNTVGIGDFLMYHDFYNMHMRYYGASGNLVLSNKNTEIHISGANGSGNVQQSIRIKSGATEGVILYHGGNAKFETAGIGASVYGTLVATGADINGDLDVDGHTNLDNVSIAGVTTLTSSSQYPLVINSSDNGKIVLQGSNAPYIRFKEQTTDKAFIQWNNDGYLELKNEEANESLKLGNGSNGLKWSVGGNDYTIWNSTNMGSGGGLDADLLDGQEGSYYTTTINSNTNNYLITGTGTANTLQGEANLTFTGSILTVTNSSGASELTLVTPSANDSGVYFNDGSNAGALTYNHSDNSMRFRVSSTEKLRIETVSSRARFNFGAGNNDFTNPDIGGGTSGVSINKNTLGQIYACTDNADNTAANDYQTVVLNVSRRNTSGDGPHIALDRGGWIKASIAGLQGSNTATSGPGSFAIYTHNYSSGQNVRTERLRINSAGRVGINTNNPQQLLDLYDVLAGASGTAPILNIRNGYSGTANASNALKSEIRFSHRNHNSAHDFMATRIIADTSDNYNQRTHLRFYVAKGNNGTERLTIDPDGEIGINNTTPAYPLDIRHDGGNKNQTPIIRLFQASDGCHNAITLESSTSADKNIGIQFKNQSTVKGGIGYIQSDKINIYTGTNAGASNGMTINASGFCGINELSPDRILHVMGDAETWPAGFESSGSSAKISFKSSGTTNMYEVGVGAEGRSLIFLTANSVRVDINTDGVMRAKTLSGSAYPIASVRDGSTSARAAQSAWEIKKTLGPAAKTGYYYLINPYDGTTNQWWCDMDTDGGGWILVAHTGDGQMSSLSTADGNHWYNRSNKGGFDTVGSGYYKGGGYWRKTNGGWGDNTCGQLMWDVRTQDSQYDNYSNAKVVFNWGTDNSLPTGGSQYTNIPGSKRFNEWCYEVVGAPGFNPSNYHQNARSNVISGANYFTEHMVITWSFRGTGGGGDDGDSPYWMLGSHHDGLHQHYEESLSGNPQGVYGSGGYYVVSNEDTGWGGGGSNDGYPRIGRHTDNGTCNVWLR